MEIINNGKISGEKFVFVPNFIENLDYISTILILTGTTGDISSNTLEIPTNENYLLLKVCS